MIYKNENQLAVFIFSIKASVFSDEWERQRLLVKVDGTETTLYSINLNHPFPDSPFP